MGALLHEIPFAMTSPSILRIWHPSLMTPTDTHRSWLAEAEFKPALPSTPASPNVVSNKLANITSPSSQHPILHLKASNPPFENWAFLDYHWFPYQPHYSCQLTHQEINRPIHARCKVLYWCKRWEVQSGIQACCLVYHGCFSVGIQRIIFPEKSDLWRSI